jgi:hypothetical protein
MSGWWLIPAILWGIAWIGGVCLFVAFLILETEDK